MVQFFSYCKTLVSFNFLHFPLFAFFLFIIIIIIMKIPTTTTFSFNQELWSCDWVNFFFGRFVVKENENGILHSSSITFMCADFVEKKCCFLVENCFFSLSLFHFAAFFHFSLASFFSFYFVSCGKSKITTIKLKKIRKKNFFQKNSC